ncbi:hypothetical protein VE04_08662, partial [Pseudogymnoascus sp. 24MN13]
MAGSKLKELRDSVPPVAKIASLTKVSTTAKERSPSSVQLELVALARESLRETGRVSGDLTDTITVERPPRTKLPDPTRPTPPADPVTADSDSRRPSPADTMTAVESHTAPSPFLDTPADPPTSRFTAVNNPTGPHHSDHPEKLTITTTNTQRDNWADTVNGDKAAGSQSVPPPPTFPDGESSHKRKRSGSVERDSAQPSSSSSYHKHSLPALKPNEQQKGSPNSPYPDSAQSSKRDAQSATRDPYVTPQTPYPHYPEESRENSAASWYSHQIDNRTPVDGGHSAVSQHHMSPDDQLREALQRENNSDGQGNYSETSPAQNDRGAPYRGEYGQVQVDHKKRKRNFSNRTKTGCMTCRKRKKKCDETRPECNNCMRGGFICNGYPSRGNWPKTEQKQGPVPLQSKDGYDASPSQCRPPPYQQQQQPQQPKREPLPSYRGQQLRVDPLQPPARPVGADEDRSASTNLSASVGSPDKRLSAISYTQANTFPTPVSAVSQSNYPDRLSQMDYQRMPPLLDQNRSEHDTGTPQSAHSPAPSHAAIPADPEAARLALSHPASNSRRTPKEEMLAGNNFFPFDRELERSRLFRDVLQPKELASMPPHLASPVNPQGYVGERCVVAAPFTCDYGYNITIGQDVSIDRNCTILDCASVKIGDRCVIGPNVSILTTTVPIDPKKRLGSKGPNQGKPIIIEEDCFIGANATILPGITVKRGSTVGACSVVTRDVPPFTVVSGNPARVMR